MELGIFAISKILDYGLVMYNHIQLEVTYREV